MFGLRRRPVSTAVLEEAPAGAILEIVCSGVHVTEFANELADHLAEALDEHRPAAVVLNFLDYRYRAGDEIAGALFRAFIREESLADPELRPCAIVACGRTAGALRGLLELGRILETFDIRFFDDVETAREHLRNRLA